MRVRLLACMCIAFLTRPVVAGEHWPEFRGPNGTGIAADADLPAEFGENQNVTWKTPIHGWGHSSPVVWGDQVWMTTATEDGLKMSAVCVAAKTGKVVHDLLLFQNKSVSPDQHASNSFASCTPTIEEGRVYCHFGHYGTACVDTKTGKVVWQRRDIVVDEFRGPASSPILFENLLIVNCDGVDVQFVLALDKRTGKTVWKADRTIDYGTEVGDLKKGYGTPSLIEVGGTPQLVSPSAVETITYDPRTGKELWRVRHGGMNAAARPLAADGLIYIAAGKDDTSLVAVRPGKGDLTKTGIAWKSGKGVSQKPSPLLIDGLLFMINDAGIASCRDAKTGEILWNERLGGDFWASPVSDGKKIFCFAKDGKIPVFAASDEFKLLAENQFEEGFHSTPAIAGNAMFVRSRHHLYRVEKQ
ncbi:MAG: PQQ-like beta-propeller repeat protein [Planctomycetota bacterium]|nr:PQQ-like beta-propeller repeat protein [Planctomycetota bacterium]